MPGPFDDWLARALTDLGVQDEGRDTLTDLGVQDEGRDA
jgi:hypothetical protein